MVRTSPLTLSVKRLGQEWAVPAVITLKLARDSIMQRFSLQECADDCTLLEVLEYPSTSLGLQVMPIFPMAVLSSLVSILLSPFSLLSLSLSPYTNRHIYNPLVSMGVGKLGAQIAVFLLSAAFHEVTCHVTVTWFVSQIM